MQIRDNVRRRRRERIEQLLGQRPGERGAGFAEADEPTGTAGIRGIAGASGMESAGASGAAGTAGLSEAEGTGSFSWSDRRDTVQDATVSAPVSFAVPETAKRRADDLPQLDPEKWWKEQQKQRYRTGPSWQGAGGLTPASAPPDEPSSGRSFLSRLAGGFAVRLAISAVLFGAAWLWFRSDLPGSREAKAWTADAVTRDMDFQAVEAWYVQTFGGSPSFLPMFRSKGESQAVIGGWKRSEATRPVAGRIVRTFAEDGGGVRIAASGGSEVKAVYAGRVLQVAAEDGGKATVLVQHAGKTVTIYGNLDQPNVRANDWVEAGQSLGKVPAPRDKSGESLLYFAVKQNGKNVDPAEVVPLD